MVAVSCERNVDNLALATYPTTPEVFIDGFSAGLNYSAWGKVTNFSIDYVEKYNGTASMKFEVPNFGDPAGNAAGGVFITSNPRDLSGYNVLTFWAKASQVDTITKVGFGSSQINGSTDETYKVTVNNLILTNTWTKYYIPIPDASKLTQEKGMFYYWADPRDGGKGFTFWIDNLQFENLGTIAHASPGLIYSGKDLIYNNVESGDYQIPDLSASYNLPTGINETVYFPSSYLTLASSNSTVASVSKPGTYTVINTGSTLITAKLADNYVKGSLLINSIGAPVLPTSLAPTPTIASGNVISIFSDKYTNATIDSFEPFWTWSGGGMTTNYSVYKLSGNNYIRYSNYNDTYNQKKVFVAISFETTPINVSAMTYFHMDVWVPASSPNLTNIPTISLEDWGANFGGTNSTGVYTRPTALVTNQWVSLEIPLTGFAGLTSRAHLVHLILDNFPTVTYVDNIYFHN
jgi:hypothetical protein